MWVSSNQSLKILLLPVHFIVKIMKILPNKSSFGADNAICANKAKLHFGSCSNRKIYDDLSVRVRRKKLLC